MAATWKMIVYVNKLEYAEHIALVKGDITTPEPVLVRMHAINIFSDMLAWKHYERDMLGESMRIIAEEGPRRRRRAASRRGRPS